MTPDQDVCVRESERMPVYHELHKQPCWMVPVDTGYRVVKLKPRAEQLPSGTRAIQYGPGLVELASVEAKT